LVEVRGQKLHLVSQGEGSPAVVMEAAIWDFSLTWSLVQPGVATFTRTLAYDRAGLGWSDPSSGRRTGEDMLADLRQLLSISQIPGPYVLVGQSFSGMLARLYAYRYPDEVAGLVLVDPAHEDQMARFPGAIGEMFGGLKASQIEQLRGVAQLIAGQGPQAAPPLLAVPESFPGEIAERYRWLATCDASRIETMIAELEALEDTQAQVRSARAASLGDLPLVVLSHGQPASVPGMPDEVNRQYENAWQEMHIEIAGMSSQGRRIVAEKSGHMIHHEQPELVVEAIRRVVDQARERGA
jgi:pimeloyl-ACP methyl ester carboxylesterase